MVLNYRMTIKYTSRYLSCLDVHEQKVSTYRCKSRRTSRELRRFRRSRGSPPTSPHTSQPRDIELLVLLFDLNKDLANE